MTEADLDIGALLQSHGYRVTAPRRAVWRVLVDAADHLTVDQIVDLVHGEDTSINVASVYRSLALFRELELARESRLGDDEGSRWELAHPDEHFHLVCDECGRVDHHAGSLVKQITDHLGRGHGFEPYRVELVVRGRCAECAGNTAHDHTH